MLLELIFPVEVLSTCSLYAAPVCNSADETIIAMASSLYCVPILTLSGHCFAFYVLVSIICHFVSYIQCSHFFNVTDVH